MWTPEVVRERFVEAAEIEHRMVLKMEGGGGYSWPSYSYTAEDRAGWDDTALQDALEVWQGRKVTKSPEITRWEECFFIWTPMVRERDRVLVWRWAQCISSGRSFSRYCEVKGLVRVTAYNRLERAFEGLASQFAVEGRLLLEADGICPLQEPAIEAVDIHTVERTDAKRAPIVHPPFRAESPRHLLKTDAAVAEFEEHLAEVNEQRRKARLRKALRGVPGEQEAA